MDKFDGLKEGLAHLKKAQDAFSKGPLTFYITELVGAYNFMMEHCAPFKVGDRVILIKAPIINANENHGWMSSKHFLIPGAKADVLSISCNEKGFQVGVAFDDESYIDSRTKEKHISKIKHSYGFRSSYFIKDTDD